MISDVVSLNADVGECVAAVRFSNVDFARCRVIDVLLGTMIEELPES